MQTDLLNLLSARKGHFKLESGHHGDLWLELDPLFLRPHQLQRFVIELARRLASYNISAICGPLTGGSLIAYTIAAELDMKFYYTERFFPPSQDRLYSVEYRLPNSLDKNIAGKTVAIVDDVINAGSAVRGTVEALQAAGAIPTVIGALLVLNTTAPDYLAARDLPIETIARQTSGLWSPSECPLCARQIPLEDPTQNDPEQA